MKEWFLLMDLCLELQLGRSRDRQLDKFDFLDSMDILIEYLFWRLRSSIKYEMSEFVIIGDLAVYLRPNSSDHNQTHKMT